tara:strand:- start:212 stop:1048 length:837 start_codon:yes stop_codon:yes gene_type:complete
MKEKKSIYQSIKKDIFKGFKRLYFFTYTISKYYYLSLKFRYSKKKIKKYKISILLPTRERSRKFNRMLNTLINTCNDISRIEILLLIDGDDKEINLYKKILREKIYEKLNIKIIIKDLKTHALRNNFLAKMCNGEIIFPINDDMIFVSKKWDKVIDKEFSKNVQNDPFCLWIKSNVKYRYLHCDYPIINREWYNRLGYVGSENFNFWYLDTWICDLSILSGRYIVTPDITVDQLSANRFQKEIDDTHLRNINSDMGNKDLRIWNETKKERLDHSKLLL